MQVVRLVKLAWVDIDSNPLHRYGLWPLIRRRAEKVSCTLQLNFWSYSFFLTHTAPTLLHLPPLDLFPAAALAPVTLYRRSLN